MEAESPRKETPRIRMEEAPKIRISLRDYKYLDENRLDDYLSSINPGVISDVTRKVREVEGLSDQSPLRSDQQYTFRVEARHSFNQLYELLVRSGSLTPVEEDS